MFETERVASPMVIDGETVESREVLPEPDLSVLATATPPADQPVKDDKEKPTPQELAVTSGAPVGLVVALVIVVVVAAVVVAMWRVSPLLALLLGGGLIVLALLVGGGWLAWRRLARRGGRPSRPGGRNRAAGSTPAGGKPTGRKPAGSKPAGSRAAGVDGKSPGAGVPPKGARTTFDRRSPAGGGKPGGGGGKKAPGSGGGWPNFGGKSGGKTDGKTGGKTGGKTDKKTDGKADKKADKKAAGDGNTTPKGDGKAARPEEAAGGGLWARLARRRAARASRAGATADAGTSGPTGGDQSQAPRTDRARPGNGGAGTPVQPTPGGHRPETVIEVDPDDISSPDRPRTPAEPQPQPRPGPAPTSSGGPSAGPAVPLGAAPHVPQSQSHHFGGSQMSSTTSTTTVDPEALRVANRYAEQVHKHETLLGRAGACRDATDMYRRDARENQASAESHRASARTIRDPNIAAEHARQARIADEEAAREILAARHYETQAETYEAKARTVAV